MKQFKFLLPIAFMGVLAQRADAQQLLTLEQSRQMALEHNQKVLIADEHVQAAGAVMRSAQTQVLPSISAHGLSTRPN